MSIGDKVRCEKCGNRIKELFIYKNNKCICRKCLVYKEKAIDSYTNGKGDYHLDYKLSEGQLKASQFVLNCVKNKENCILNAITGAGKTEIIYQTIEYCINNRLKIAIAIPRKDVVIELSQRLKKDFKLASIVSIYGGNIKELSGDVVILTTHQLYRYNNYFDVVVIDEVDAFPFYNNEILHNFLIRSVRGNIVYMSATIPKELLNSGWKIYYLNRRYHNEPLDIPKIKYFWNIYSIRRFLKSNSSCVNIIYFPTIKLENKFSKRLKLEHYLINSQTKDRKQLLDKLHEMNKMIILSTLVLERGITFKNTNVVVCLADHKLFRFENLVQIAGRVGRHYLYPHGKIIFLVNRKDRKIRKVIKFIKQCNE